MRCNEKILVVDDDEITRIMLEETLFSLGYEVLVAENGDEAVHLFRHKQPDLVLTDVMMPIKDGFKTCAEIREISGLTPILIMTASGSNEDIDKAFIAGATDFLMKPLNWPLLGQRVRYALRTSEKDREIERQQIKLLHAQRIARLAYWEYDLQTDIVTWSEEVTNILGIITNEEMTFDQFIDTYVYEEDRQLLRTTMDDTLTHHSDYGIEHRIMTPSKHEKIVYSRGEIQYKDNKQPSYILGVIQDISELRKTQKQLSYLTNHDGLTGLPNRVLLKDRMNRTVLNATRRSKMVGILYLGLDQFKHINNTLGNLTGDNFLRNIAECLENCVRSDDTVGRWGSDEFLIILSELSVAEDSARIAGNILKHLKLPMHLDNHELYPSASIGISLYPIDGTDVASLQQNAAVAMMKAKDAGGDRYRYYTTDMNERALERLTLESNLRHALDKQEYVLFYQPQIDLTSQKIVGFEALIRWRHNDSLISPAIFIPMLEQSGFIINVGSWVLLEASKACQNHWLNLNPNFRISVNVSNKQLNDDLIPLVNEVIAQTGIDPNLLELEITESVIMEDVQTSMEILQTIADMGIYIAIDDFGTGYSSLAYLKKLPVHTLKIDMSFVKGMSKNSEDAAIVRSTIDLAHSLGLQVIAEGVEDYATQDMLKDMQCDIGQGFGIGKPMPIKECLDWIKERPDIK